ncbi:MAG: hypothetical protein MRY83_10605 [Flavobacteriales bacterium]|nr:hypothetical protein [Flavobacteriales bacterium]
MKKLSFILLLFIILGSLGSAQAQYADIAPKLKAKAYRKIINRKMDALFNRITAESGCPKSDISYAIIETFSYPYPKAEKQLPKTLVLTVCGEKKTYINTALTGHATYWEMGNWVLNSVTKKENL